MSQPSLTGETTTLADKLIPLLFEKLDNVRSDCGQIDIIVGASLSATSSLGYAFNSSLDASFQLTSRKIIDQNDPPSPNEDTPALGQWWMAGHIGRRNNAYLFSVNIPASVSPVAFHSETIPGYAGPGPTVTGVNIFDQYVRWIGESYGASTEAYPDYPYRLLDWLPYFPFIGLISVDFTNLPTYPGFDLDAQEYRPEWPFDNRMLVGFDHTTLRHFEVDQTLENPTSYTDPTLVDNDWHIECDYTTQFILS